MPDRKPGGTRPRTGTHADDGAPDPQAERYRATSNKKQVDAQVDGQGKAAETIVDEHGRARDLGRQGRAGRHDRDKDAG